MVPREQLSGARARLVALLEYVENLVKSARPHSTLEEHSGLRLFETDLRGLPGITFNVADGEDSVWLRIERLTRQDPPQPDEDLRPWIAVPRDPEQSPVVSPHVLETVPRRLAEQFVSREEVDRKDVLEIPGREHAVPHDPSVQILRRLERLPAIKARLTQYVEGPWAEWSLREKPRRRTIAIYDQLFQLQQAIEAESTERPIEVVWGIGIARRKDSAATLNYPLVLQLVEIEIDIRTHAITVRPSEIDPVPALDPYIELETPGVAAVKAAFSAAFTREDYALSPFERSTYEELLRLAATKLDEHGEYWPDRSRQPEDRSIPPYTDHLRVTDLWVLFARPRSESFLLQDLERLKQAVRDAEQLPPASKAFVEDLPDEHRPAPGGVSGARGGGSAGGPAPTGSSGVAEFPLYFPKPFNDEQVEIIRLLETADGIVVQGPPGTGKTHTIANIICHMLAHGRRVLVTSKGEPALAVLRDQIPPAIQPLTISLLTSEREGMKQLQVAVDTLATHIVRLSEPVTRAEAEEQARRVDDLRRKLAIVDQDIQEWAIRQIEPVTGRFGLNSEAITARDLALRVVHERNIHDWLPDSLGSDERFSPQFDESDIAAIRTARKRLGPDLVYLSHELPNASDFVAGEDLADAHGDLLRAHDLEAQAISRQVPSLARSLEDAVRRAGDLQDRLRQAKPLLASVLQSDWLTDVLRQLRSSREQVLELGPLIELFDPLQELRAKRREFLARPVHVQDGAHANRHLREAVSRAALGQRPFSIVAFGQSEVKAAFHAIRVSGLPPGAPEVWRHVLAFFAFLDDTMSLATRWNALCLELGLPEVTSQGVEAARELDALRGQLAQVEQILELCNGVVDELRLVLPAGLRHDAVVFDLEELDRALEALDLHLSRNRLSAARLKVAQQLDKLRGKTGPIVEAMQAFLTGRVGQPGIEERAIQHQWDDFLAELRSLADLRGDLDIVRRVASAVTASGAALWGAKLAAEPVSGGEDPWTPSTWRRSWNWKRQSAYLSEIDGRGQLKELATRRSRLDDDLKKAIERLVELRTHLALRRKMTPRVQAALNKFLIALKGIGVTGTGVRARRHIRDARAAMEQAHRAVPCWVMPHWRVAQQLPSELGSFDLVIIDEASQSDVTALPALLRGAKLLVVGDDKQVSPSAVGVEERRLLQLKSAFLQGQPHGSLMLPGTSIYDLASAMFAGNQVMLREHFRCVEPIIQFSNRFYNGEIRPLRIPKASERLEPPLIDVFVRSGYRAPQSKINKPEADAIVEEIKRIAADPALQRRTLGVVSLIGNEQARYIQQRLIAELGEDVYLRHQITCGDSMTFQGKERDIMFISMVATPSDVRAQTGQLWEQRFNVACSRARDRMYLVHSVTREQLGDRDLKAQVLDHFKQPIPGSAIPTEDLRSLCESDFERDVFDRLVQKGYRVAPQERVGQFRIDLVIEGQNDRRLAVELDGDSFHTPGRWLEDIRRQRILERAGWQFWRCWASSFVLNPEGCMADLEAALAVRGIQPAGGQGRRSVFTEFRTIGEAAGEAVQPHVGEPERPTAAVPAPGELFAARPSRKEAAEAVGQDASETVEVHDRVVYCDTEKPNIHKTVLITDGKSDPDMGIIGKNAPLAQALLGASVDDEVEVQLPRRVMRVVVLAIEKPGRKFRQSA